MAFALRHLDRFVESSNDSELLLNVIDERSEAVFGKYKPRHRRRSSIVAPESSLGNDGMLAAESTLIGTAEHRPGWDYKMIRGRWQHMGSTAYGHREQGWFDMKIDAFGQAAGTWIADSEPDMRHPWTWTATPAKDSKFFQFVNSMAMVQYGLLSAWLFLGMTAQQLWFSCGSTWAYISHANLVFNVVYSVIYASFLFAYASMRSAPHFTYITGVVLYTCGYVAFAALFALVTAQVDVPQRLYDLYLLGSLLFLSGSGFLCYATWQRYAIFSKAGSLFMGSFMFLLGSVAFTLDAAKIMEIEATSGIPVLVVVGYACFVPGRAFFVHGSSTDDCDVLLRRIQPGNKDVALKERTSVATELADVAAGAVARASGRNSRSMMDSYVDSAATNRNSCHSEQHKVLKEGTDSTTV